MLCNVKCPNSGIYRRRSVLFILAQKAVIINRFGKLIAGKLRRLTRGAK